MASSHHSTPHHALFLSLDRKSSSIYQDSIDEVRPKWIHSCVIWKLQIYVICNSTQISYLIMLCKTHTTCSLKSAMWSLSNQSMAHNRKTHKHSIQTLQWIQFLTWYPKCRPNLWRQYTHVHPCSSVDCCLYTSALACISRHLPPCFSPSQTKQ